jgi:release factor glutamine methyltransferase
LTVVAAALRAARARLASAGVENPMLDSRLLLARALGVPTSHLTAAPDRELRADEHAAYEQLLQRRAAREPIAYILRRREFWSLDFVVTPATLVPRPETETLVEAALAGHRDLGSKLRILDLGTGSGCVLLALLHERAQANGLGVDISAAAISVARLNAERLGLVPRAEWLVRDWRAGVEGRFDLVVANPPYIAHAELETLAPEVREHEPRAALDGGPDGLDAYRDLLKRIPGWLAPDGLAMLEIGAGQASKLCDLVTRGTGLVIVDFKRDLAAIERVAVLREA